MNYHAFLISFSLDSSSTFSDLDTFKDYRLDIL